MSRRQGWSLLLGLCAVGLLGVALQTAPNNVRTKPKGWEKVQQAQQRGLPKTAIGELEPILKTLLKQKNYPWAIRAIGLKIQLETKIQGNKPHEAIIRLEEELEKAPLPMKPVLRAVLANWYWQFYQQNRWRFLRRTQATGGDEGTDILAWSLPRILREIDRQFMVALKAEPQLRKIPLSDYAAIVQPGSAPSSYRPTLFDFLAYNALEFYSIGEQAAHVSSDAFTVDAASPIFDDVDRFLAWELPQPDGYDPYLKALHLYQRILRIHKQDDDRSAWIDADLSRLVFGRKVAVGADRERRYVSALKHFTRAYGDHPITARAFYLWAEVLYARGDWAAARKIALQGVRRAPDSVGARNCRALIDRIEAKQLTVAVERVWSEPWPKIEVQYRNITRLHFRIVRIDIDAWLASNRRHPEQLPANGRHRLLKLKPVKQWSVTLPKTEDYRPRNHTVRPPRKLKRGAYYLIAGSDADFGTQDNLVVFRHFWVSDLAVVVRSSPTMGVFDGIVTDARSGKPLAEATVKYWGYRNGRRTLMGQTETDAQGRFEIGVSGVPFILDVHYGNDRVASGQYDQVASYRQPNQTRESTFFFMDRAIYRPGQTVQYKGLAVRIDPRRNRYQVLAGRTVVVAFRDTNGKEIARQRHRTNEFGSFHGSFTAPGGKLLGAMQLTVVDGPRGGQSFRVEEYKRPKFRTELEDPAAAPRLGRPVTMTGKAAAYTGAPIDGATVRWRVVRRPQIPYWWMWRRGWFDFTPQVTEIATGRTKTDGQGRFELTFPATPDPQIDSDTPARFYFQVTVDVIDATGETRSANRTVVIGRQMWWADLTADQWQETGKPVKWRIHVTSLSGKGVETKGTLKIYRLQQPRRVIRKPARVLFGPPVRGIEKGGAPEPTSDPRTWPMGEEVVSRSVETDDGGVAEVEIELEAGVYRAVFETRDPSGQDVTAQHNTHVLDLQSNRLEVKIPYLCRFEKTSVQPGETLRLVWGTGYKGGRALVEIVHRDRIVRRFWTDSERTQQVIEVPIDEAMRGGFTVCVTMVRENRLYETNSYISVPWTNRRLVLKWEHFVSKLKPGQHETWTLVVSGPDTAQDRAARLKAAAEVVATLYDASLDAFSQLHWSSLQYLFYRDRYWRQSRFFNTTRPLVILQGRWKRPRQRAALTYPSFHPDVMFQQVWARAFGNRMSDRDGGRGTASAMMLKGGAGGAEAAAEAMQDAAQGSTVAAEQRKARRAGPTGSGAKDAPPQVDLDAVSLRKNLKETAFFFPQLRTDDQGKVRIEFTMPEALTEWRFLALAHDRQLRSGSLIDKAVTRKELMVQPNPPRFLRENDTLEFTAKIVNQSATRQQGRVRLRLADARTDRDLTGRLGAGEATQSFDIPAGRSATVSWRLHVPDGTPFLVYRVVAATDRLSDGEENYLPVLPRRILVTESLPLPIRGPGQRTWDWKRLTESSRSGSIRHQSLTLQAVSQPAWYAVLALPYLMEFPHECSEQVFNRIYANLLARKIITGDPKMRRVIAAWKNTPAELSPLEKNQDLKAVMLEETPWVRQAESETQARKNLAILFDENRIRNEVERALQRLRDTQHPDGAWPWFPGGGANDYITLYIVTGFARLEHLGIEVDMSLARKAIPRIDQWLQREYDRIVTQGRLDANHLTPMVAFYLYGRSFYLESRPVPDRHRKAFRYFVRQAEQYWLQVPRQSQGHLALALHRLGKTASAKAIMRSIREHAVIDEELGMFWRDTERSWWWYRAPIETQALMIEAFDEVMNDTEAVDDCQVWLIKQKQTQDWKTTKATADACFALLRRGADRLASDVLLEVSLGGSKIEPEDVEAGTGFYEKRFVGPEIKPRMGRIKLVKRDPGVAWASLHWQYFEDMSKVKAYEGTPLTLRKRLFIKRYGEGGPKLEPIDSGIRVGDVLVVRLELRVDRAMEYVHLKDQRPSGSEPVDVLSGYRYQDGLAYYQMTRDTASHFFIDYLPKGTYVFEYESRIQHRGKYQSGMARIQCMYAPEFNSHSQSFTLEVTGEEE